MRLTIELYSLLTQRCVFLDWKVCSSLGLAVDIVILLAGKVLIGLRTRFMSMNRGRSLECTYGVSLFTRYFWDSEIFDALLVSTHRDIVFESAAM